MSRIGGHPRLSGSALQSRVAQFGRRSFIKSIQRGTLVITNTNTTATATITSVDVNNSVLRLLGLTTDDTGAQPDRDWARITLTNATTITGTRSNSINAVTLSYEIIEYYSGVIKSSQFGTAAITSTNTTGTATVTTVDTTKTECAWLGESTTVGTQTDQNRDSFTRVALTNATTVTATRQLGSTGTAVTVGFQLVEYY